MSENRGHIDALIVRALSQSIESGEEMELEAWKEASESNRDYFIQMQALWDSSAEIRAFDQVDVEEDYKMLASRIGFAEEKRIGIRPMVLIRNIAAVVVPLIMIGIGVTLYQTTPGFGKWVALSSDGAVRQLVLPDQSEVDLNTNSRITFEKGLKGDERRITLEGEAFFKVTKNPERPFVIKIGETEVKVLGTQFYLEEEGLHGETTLIVTEGRVQFSSGHDQVVVSQGESASFTNGHISKVNTIPYNNMAWRTGTIKFDKSGLDEVLSTLLDHFGSQIEEVENNTRISDREITTSFDSPTLEEVLDELRIHFNKKFTLSGRKLVISD